MIRIEKSMNYKSLSSIVLPPDISPKGIGERRQQPPISTPYRRMAFSNPLGKRMLLCKISPSFRIYYKKRVYI